MAVFRVERNRGYTVMSNHHLRNRGLTLKAKGLLSQMLSLPDNWDYTLAGLSRINREKIDAIREAVRELEKAGYIVRSRERDEKGRLRGADYIIYEQPQPPVLDLPTLENPTLDNPTLEKPMLENPTLENPTHLNKDMSRTDLSKKEKSNTDTLLRYNPEIVSATKETALTSLMEREAKDNAIAAQKGLKPYTLLNVEFNDGADSQNSGYMGWYYVTLAVDGKICSHIETGLNYDIADGKVSAEPTREKYFAAGALKDSEVDYVFNNVGFSSTSGLYALPVSAAVLQRAEKTLAERTKAQEPDRDSFSIYQLKRGDETRDLRFEPYDRLTAMGHAVDPANYDLIYSAPLAPGTNLEDIFTRFNIDHPKDFKGHSLSVSDVVVLHQNGQDTAHYVDSIGYRQTPEFLQPQNYLKHVEDIVEQNDNNFDGSHAWDFGTIWAPFTEKAPLTQAIKETPRTRKSIEFMRVSGVF